MKIGIIGVAIVLAVAPLPRGVIEQLYARGVYPAIQPRLTALSNAVPFALFDVLIAGCAAAAIVVWIAHVRRRRTRQADSDSAFRRWLSTLIRFGADAAVIASVLYLWFLAVWGLNYRREPLHAQLDFREQRITRDALRALAVRNVQSLNALHAGAHASGWPELAATSSALAPAFTEVQRDLAFTWAPRAARPKATLLNFYFTRVAIDGMTDPFFLETLANQTLLPFERAATVAHEWSHLAGFADESEANFVGWLVCMRGPAAVQYSGWLSLYGTVMSALPRADRDEMLRRLADGPRADLRAISERMRRYMVPAARRVGYAVYDRYLKANRVEAGVRSYDQVLRLLLGTAFDEHGAPKLRR